MGHSILQAANYAEMIREDGDFGYGVDDYGFTRSFWSHELEVV